LADPTLHTADRADLLALDAKLNALLPPRYQHCYTAVSPVSMGTADLKFDANGRVAWNEMWTTFCDLALAGGPPHRGTLLAPAAAEEVHAVPEKYQTVVEEIGRGIWLVTELPVLLRIAPGWVAVHCRSEAMAAWLLSAVIVENILARRDRQLLYLPAGPHFRLAREIKNVVTALAKTCHYWTDHMPASQQTAVAALLCGPAADTSLLEPASPAETCAAPNAYQTVVEEMERGLRQATGSPAVPSPVPGWVGFQCASEEMAVWLMRAILVENVLVRREANVLYLPASPRFAAADGSRKVVETFVHARRLWEAQAAL